MCHQIILSLFRIFSLFQYLLFWCRYFYTKEQEKKLFTNNIIYSWMKHRFNIIYDTCPSIMVCLNFSYPYFNLMYNIISLNVRQWMNAVCALNEPQVNIPKTFFIFYLFYFLIVFHARLVIGTCLNSFYTNTKICLPIIYTHDIDKNKYKKIYINVHTSYLHVCNLYHGIFLNNTVYTIWTHILFVLKVWP